MTLYYATFLCVTESGFDRRLDLLSGDFGHFKKLGSNRNLDDAELLYLRIFYKLPKLMKLKRGFRSAKSGRKRTNKVNFSNGTDEIY